MGLKITVVVSDNRGFGCINRLQKATGGAEFNNLLDHAVHQIPSQIDFAAHAASMGAVAEKVGSVAELEKALERAREASDPTVMVTSTDPCQSTEAGGHWWGVAVPEIAERSEVLAARKNYETERARQRAD